MHRGLLDGFKFKLIRSAASFIQKLARPRQRFLIRPIDCLQSENSNQFGLLEKIGIVIQGPITSILEAQDLAFFVHQLTKVVDSNYLVVSTWDSEFSRGFEQLVSCKVILSRDEGFENNFQRQLFSTTAGLNFLKACNAEVSIKVRVDQRFDLSAITLLNNLSLNARFRGRLVFSSMNSYTHRFFGLSDMLNAGSTDDLLDFWSPDILSEYFDTSNSTIELPFSSWINEIRPHWFESFLCIRFAFLRGAHFTQSPWNDYIDFLSNWVVLVDSELINQTWSKIQSPLYSLTERSLYNPSVAYDDSELTQSIWFAISEGGYRPPKRSYDFKH
jgi:WavE lipopolysaccharide synthesis